MNLSLSPAVSELNDEIIDLWTRYGSGGSHERQPFIPTDENISELEDQHGRFKARAAPVSPQNLLDEVTLLHMENLAEVLEFRLQDDRAFPFRYLTSLNSSINSLLFMDERLHPERVSILAARLAAAEELLAEICCKTAAVSEDRQGMTREYLINLAEVLENLEQSLHDSDIPPGTEGRDELVKRADSVARRARYIVSDIDCLEDPAEEVDPLPYDERLKRVWGIELSELLSWHEEEVARSTERFERIAADIDPHKSPHEILDKELPCCNNPDEMFPLMEEYVERARRESLQYITLPEGETCEVWPVPHSLKDSYPWGGCMGPDPLLDSLKGAVFLNQHNYRAVTLGWMMMMAIHECYPGHHAQRVKTITSPLPDCFKLGHLMSRAGPLNEGAAHRSETLLQHIFPERAFPLFIALRRLHTAVRITADLKLHHLGGSVEEVVSLYQQRLGFSRKAARGQVRFQELWPGYMTIYYYGQKYLARLEQSLDWGEEEFTELIFSVGYGGLPVLQAVIDLPEETRAKMLW